MTIAQLKRDIEVGRKVEVLEVWEHGQKLEVLPEKMQGVGEVVSKDSTGFYIMRPKTQSRKGSFCKWPKKGEFSREGDVFTITDNWGKRVYKLI